MDLLPVFQNVKGRPALVVGSGTAAARKAELISRAGASVTVIAPDLGEDMAQLAAERGIAHRTGDVGPADFEGCALAFGASEHMALNERVHDLAVAAGVPVNVVDRPELCQFIMPAILDRDGVVVAVSSGGDAPLLARMIKGRFETLVPTAYGRLARFGGAWRDRVKAAVSDGDLPAASGKTSSRARWPNWSSRATNRRPPTPWRRSSRMPPVWPRAGRWGRCGWPAPGRAIQTC